MQVLKISSKETRIYEKTIAEDFFQLLKEGVMKFMNEMNFKRFLMIVRSAGFIDKSMILSQNVLHFAYIVYLILKSQNNASSEVEGLVSRWLVMSALTRRYSGSSESQFDFDIRSIDEVGVAKYRPVGNAGGFSAVLYS